MRPRQRVVAEPVTFSKERLAAVCDGVAAITATILVFDLKVPFDDADDILSLTTMREQAHLLLGWAISFLMVGVIWFEQHLVFANSARIDTPFIVMAMVQLAFLSLIPFGSLLVGGYPTNHLAGLIFSVIMFLNGMMVALQSIMLARWRHLHRGPEARALARRGKLQLATYLGVALFSVVLTVIHVPLTGVVAWVLSPMFLALYGPKVPSGANDAAQPDAGD